MENFKRSVKRLLTRLTVLGLVVICGAIAIAQANKERAIANAADSALDTTAAAFNDVGIAVNNAKRAVANGAQEVTQAAVQTTQNATQVVQAAGEDVNSFTADALAEWAETGQDTAQAQPLNTESAPPKFMEDSRVTQAQSVQPVGNRFNESPPVFSGGPTQGSPASRFQQQPESTVAQNGPPALFADSDVPPPSTQQLDLPTADTSLPFEAAEPSRFATGGGQAEAPASRFREEQDLNAQFTQDAFPNDRFGAPQQEQPAHPLRGGTVLRDDLRADTGRAAPAATVESMQNIQPPPANTFAQPTTPSYGAAEAGGYGNSSLESSLSGNSLSGAGRPGPSEQEGPQNAGITIHKIAPRNVRVGKPATFEIKVRNNSQVPAENVLIRDEVPVGTQLVDTNPQAKSGASGGVLWEIGTLRPNEDAVVRMKVTPLKEGVIGSVASVTYQAFASAQVKATRPQLTITHETKERVLVGDTVRFAIKIENPGSGPATDVVIEEDVPAGLSHAKGPTLRYDVGTIPPGGSRRLELALKAAKPGMVENVIVARSADDLVANHRVTLEVIAPKLQVKIKGPAKRYLERKATYTVAIENPGTADATNVEILTQLPRGLKFMNTNNNGRYDAATNSIRWTLARLPARQFGEVQFTAIPMNKGDFNIAASATGDNGLKDAQDHPLRIEGLAALLFEVKDMKDPIQVGDETIYQIRVQNQGTETANNVRFVAMVPQGMEAVSAEGPTNYQLQENRVVFDAITRLPAKGESTYNVRVKGVQPNDHRFRVEMISDNMRTPVTEEESAQVYSD